MKKIVLNGLVVILGFTSLSAENYSCNQIVSMTDSEVKNYINQLKQSLDVKDIHQDKIKNESIYINDIYKITSQKNRCLLLRVATKKPVEDIERVKALVKLSKDKRLVSNEKNIYNNALKVSSQRFSAYSRASLISQEACSYPLLYLSAEKIANDKVLIYEKRLLKNEIKTFSKDVSLATISKVFGSNRKIKNKYLNYLNTKGMSFPLLKNPHDIYQSNFNSNNEKQILLNSFTVKLTKNMKAVHYRTASSCTLFIGNEVTYDGENHNEIFFLYNKTRYRVSKNTWHNSIKERD